MSLPLSRRDALALLLGAPLAAQACRCAPSRRIDGEIRGGSHTLGHRLRDATVERASGEPERIAVAIVGAGPAGLSAAWRLDHLGVDRFVIFDLEPQAGGTSAFGTDGVVPYPWGAHYVPLPTADNPALVRLFDEMGVLEQAGASPRAKETRLVRDPPERVFVDGVWAPGLFPAWGAGKRDLSELSRFDAMIQRWVGRRDARGRRAFTLPVACCSDEAELTELDGLSAADLLKREGFESPRLRWYAEYACRDDYGLTLDETSAWAFLFYFAARTPEPGAPSAPYVTWPEGNGRLVRHLAARAGARLNLGRLVTDVVPRQTHVDLSVLDATTNELRLYRADHVILAVPRFVAARVLRPWRSDPPPYTDKFSYGAWMVANIHLSKRPKSPGFPFAWDNVLYDSPSLGYVVATHQTLRDYGPTVWTYYYPFVDGDPDAARRRLLETDHAAFCDAIVSDLGRAHVGLEDAIERIDVWRWGHAMVRPRPGFIWSDARRRAAAPVGRVHFAHSDLSGLALFEEAQYQGLRAAEAVARARGHEVETWLPPG